MPKVVDPQQRREAIADAVLAVVAREGLSAATLRNVAAEASLAIGSVRHYFDGHEDLIVFAVQDLNRRIETRIWAHAQRIIATLTVAGSRAERRRLCEELLCEWLPLDDRRYQEAVLRLTFTVAARHRTELRPHADALRETMTTVVARLLVQARAAGGIPAGLDVDVAAAHLCAVLDGLSTQGAQAPDGPTPALRTVLHHHLKALV